MLPTELWFQTLLFGDVYFITSTATLIHSSFGFLKDDTFWKTKFNSYSKCKILPLLLENQNTMLKRFSFKELCCLAEFENLYTISEERKETEKYSLGRLNIVGNEPKRRDLFAIQMNRPTISTQDYSYIGIDFLLNNCFGSDYSSLPYCKLQVWHNDGTGGREYRSTLRSISFRNLDAVIILFDSFDMLNYFSKSNINEAKGSIGKAIQALQLAQEYETKNIIFVACNDPLEKYTLDLQQVKEFCEENSIFFFQIQQTKTETEKSPYRIQHHHYEFDKVILEQLKLFSHALVVMTKKRKVVVSPPKPKEEKKSWRCTIL